MRNLLYLAHLDTLAVLARLHKLAPREWKPVEARGETNNPLFGLGASLVLRGHANITRDNWLEDLPVGETDDLKGWPSMRRLLAQAAKTIMATELGQRHLSGEIGRAMVSRLDPGSTIFWHEDDGPYHERHVRFHIPLVTNPGCQMYSGPEMVHMPQGSLWWFNNRVRHSAANFGASMRLHLVFEMRKLADE